MERVERNALSNTEETAPGEDGIIYDVLKGNIIPYEDQVKFLGLMFDQKLTWGPPIYNLKKKVKNQHPESRVHTLFGC